MRFRRSLVLAVALAAATGLPVLADEATAVAKAQAALGIHDYAGAVAALNAEIATGSKSAEVYSLRCLALGQLGRANDALADCDRAIALDPTFADAYKVRGDLYLDHFDPAKGLKDLDTFLAAKPDDVNGLWSRCDARRRTGDIPGATDDCTRAAALLPRSAQIRISLGRLALIGKKYADAYADFDFAVTSNPRDTVALYWRGFTALQQSNYRGAVDDLTAAIAAGDSAPETLANRARAYHGLGNDVAGKADMDAAIVGAARNGLCDDSMTWAIEEAVLFHVTNIKIPVCSK